MRSFLAFGALLATAMLASTATAQETDDSAPPPDQQAEDADRGDRPERPNREEMRRRMLERFDADGDGKLSDEEREKSRAEMRERRGREGRREPGRPGPGGPPPHGPGFPPNPMRLFNAFDENKDQQLSKDEFEKLMSKLREMVPPPGGPRHRGGPGPDGRGPGEGRPRRPRDDEDRRDRPRRPRAEPSEAPAEQPTDTTT